MKTTNNTVLITGGGSGIGLAIAKKFAENGNRVIITGRNENRLQQAAATLENVTAIACDVTDPAAAGQLIEQLKKEFGGINILVNNAGIMLPAELTENSDAVANARKEFEINFFSVLDLNQRFLPLLAANEEAAIINVSSGVAFTPILGIATYSASKAAAHNYTQTLRMSLELATPQIKVFEVMPGYVDTDMTAGSTAAKVPASLVADQLFTGLENNQYEIHNSDTLDVYPLYLTSPDMAIRKFNGLPY